MRAQSDGEEGCEVDLESLRWSSLIWVVPVDLGSSTDAELRRAHDHVMHELYEVSPIGPMRMGIRARVLKPIEKEMRRRGLDADYWSAEHSRRSALPFTVQWIESGLDRGCTDADYAVAEEGLRRDLAFVTEELASVESVADEALRLRLEALEDRLRRELREMAAHRRR